jgi:hypothetical protein
LKDNREKFSPGQNVLINYALPVILVKLNFMLGAELRVMNLWDEL